MHHFAMFRLVFPGVAGKDRALAQEANIGRATQIGQISACAWYCLCPAPKKMANHSQSMPQVQEDVLFTPPVPSPPHPTAELTPTGPSLSKSFVSKSSVFTMQ